MTSAANKRLCIEAANLTDPSSPITSIGPRTRISITSSAAALILAPRVRCVYRR
jgi:hypothetical protein